MHKNGELYFLNIMKTRLDQHVKRGALVKALAIGTSYSFILEPLTKLVEVALDTIFDL
jgi:hypothetical protein